MMWDFGWDFGLAIGFPSLKNERDAVTRGWGEEGDKGDKGDWDIEISEFRIPNSKPIPLILLRRKSPRR